MKMSRVAMFWNLLGAVVFGVALPIAGVCAAFAGHWVVGPLLVPVGLFMGWVKLSLAERCARGETIISPEQES